MKVYSLKKTILKTILARYTSYTQDQTVYMGQRRHIKVDLFDLDSLQTPVLSLEHDCDEILFHPTSYTTITYGCCLEENKVGIYTYNKERISEGHRAILSGYIPSDGIRIYTSWKKYTAGLRSIGYNDHFL